MSIVIAAPSPEDQLLYACESLSDLVTTGMSAASNFTQRLLGAMPGVIGGFFPVAKALDAPREQVSQLVELKLSRDQKKFMEVVAAVPYSDLRELRAFVPGGLNVTYLEYLSVLLPATECAMDVRASIIEPYMMLLAKLVSDKQGAIGTQNYASTYKKMAADREQVQKEFARCYKHNSEETQTTVKHVIERNSDWRQVLQMVNACAANLEAVDLPGIQKQLAQCSDYLNVLYERLKSGEVGDTTREAAQGLADGAYTVAQEMTALSSTYFRTLQLTTAVNDTIKHVNESMG